MLNSEMGIAATVPIEAVEQEGQREMQDLLEQLKTEPTVEAEVTAKFALFEAYLQTVEKMRSETFGFWDEVKADFHATGVADMDRSLKRIDNRVER